MLPQTKAEDSIGESPFKQYVLMEFERARLYQTFVLIDELPEISARWLEFSNFCAKSLANVSSISSLLSQRYLDEWTRDQKQIQKDELRKSHLTSRIENIQEFQMGLAILMIIYADIVNSGVFNSGPSKDYCQSYIEGFRILDRISATYFNSSHPKASSIEEIMLSFLLINQKQNIIKIMENSPHDKNALLKEKSAYELTQAEFGTAFNSRFLKRVGEDWWWKDPIALNFTFERSLSHLNKAVSLYEKIEEDLDIETKEIKKKLIPLNQVWRNHALTEHYFRLSIEAAKNDIFIASVEYLNLVVGLEDESLELIEKIKMISQRNQALKEEIIRGKKIHSFLRGIAGLALMSNQLIRYIRDGDKKEVNKIIKKMEKKINEPHLNTNINYISSLPLVYLNFIQQIKISFLQKSSLSNSLKKAETVFEKFIERIIAATVDLLEGFMVLGESELGGDISVIEHLLENVQTIRVAIYFLPASESKVDILKEVETLDFMANSMLIQQKIESRKSNEILNLIYHAKAHYFSSKALEVAQQGRKPIIPRKFLENIYSKTFVKGLDVELRLFELARQFLFLNTVLEKLSQGYQIAKSKDKTTKEGYIALLNRQFSTFHLFESINKQIAEDCNELLNHKQLFGSASSKINWKTIEAKKHFSTALSHILEAAKNTILGYGADTQKDKYKAISFFGIGSKFANNASDAIQPITHYDKTFAQLAKSTYEYSVLLKELERKSRENDKLQELPLEELLGVLKQLAFLS